MEQGRAGLDAVVEQQLDEAVVEGDSFAVDAPPPVGDHAGPGDRESVALEAEVGHHRHVALEPVVVVAGDVAGVAFGHLALGVRERVPDAAPAATVEGCALDLIAGGGSPPEEAVGKIDRWSLGHVAECARTTT